MTIWALALVLLAVIATLGYLQGVIQFLISCIGMVVGLIVARPLGDAAFTWLGNKVKPGHPSLGLVLPYIAAFLVVYLVFVGLGILTQWLVNRKLRSADEDLRVRFSRLSHRLGMALGAMVALVWLWGFCVFIYTAGYPVAQLNSPAATSKEMKFVDRAVHDLYDTGLQKWAAAYVPLPVSLREQYFTMSDTLGFFYHNPDLFGRLPDYPLLLTVESMQPVRDILSDSELVQSIRNQGDVLALAQNSKIQALFTSTEAMNLFAKIDQEDLQEFLRTGKSPLYENEPIVGRWRLDPYSTFVEERRRRSDISVTEMRQLKTIVTTQLTSVAFLATLDHRIFLGIGNSTQTGGAQGGRGTGRGRGANGGNGGGNGGAGNGGGNRGAGGAPAAGGGGAGAALDPVSTQGLAQTPSNAAILALIDSLAMPADPQLIMGGRGTGGAAGGGRGAGGAGRQGAGAAGAVVGQTGARGGARSGTRVAAGSVASRLNFSAITQLLSASEGTWEFVDEHYVVHLGSQTLEGTFNEGVLTLRSQVITLTLEKAE